MHTKTDIETPAVSYYLQILKDGGVLKVWREGTKNYCYTPLYNFLYMVVGVID